MTYAFIYRYEPKAGWIFGGFHDSTDTFELDAFRKDNPHGEVMLLNMDRISDDMRLGLATVTVEDGRVVDVFKSGSIQVYSPKKDHGYEIKLPDPDVVAKESGPLSVMIHPIG